MKYFFLISILLLKISLSAQINQTYRPGEDLTYVLFFGLINAGLANFTLEETVLNGETVYHGKAVGKTTGLADRVFGVEDVFESYFDPTTGLPIKFIRNIKEGKYRQYNEVLFDHTEDSVTTTKSGKHKIPHGTLDILTAFYYLRTLNYDTIQNGDIIKITTFFDDEVFPFYMRYRGKEKIKTKLDEFYCHKFVPFVEPGRVFKTEDDMTIWITDDENMIPVRIKFDLFVGSIKCDLIEYKGVCF